MLAVVPGDAGGPGRAGRSGDVRRLFDANQPLLDLADAGEVFFELALIGAAEPVFEVARVLAHEVEDAVLVALAALRLVVALAGSAEQALEDEARIDFLGDRRGFIAPGE